MTIVQRRTDAAAVAHIQNKRQTLKNPPAEAISWGKKGLNYRTRHHKSTKPISVPAGVYE